MIELEILNCRESGESAFVCTHVVMLCSQRIYFHRLKYLAFTEHKEMELEMEHSKRMHLEKELQDFKNLQAMRHSLDAMRQV
jgi:hypothetical protein